MNKLFTRISMALVGIAMAVGVGVAAGVKTEARAVEATTDTTTFTSKAWAGNSNYWKSDKDGGQLSSGRGVQVSTGSSGAGATSANSIEDVTKVQFTYSTNASAGAGSIGVKIGSNNKVSKNITKTGGTTDRTIDFDFSPSQTGKITFDITCTTNSIYVKSVAVVYGGGGGGGDPEPEAAYTVAFSVLQKGFTAVDAATIESAETKYDTKTFNNLEWTLKTVSGATKNVKVVQASQGTEAIQIGTTNNPAVEFSIKSDVFGSEKPKVTGVTVVAYGASNDSVATIGISADEGSFGNTKSLSGTTVTSFEFTSTGAYGHISLNFTSITKGIKIASISVFAEEDTTDKGKAYAFASKVEPTNSCNDTGKTTLISEYNGLTSSVKAIADAITLYDVPEKSDDDFGATYKNKAVTLSTKMAYITAKWGGGSGSLIVSSQPSNFATTTLVIIVISAVSLVAVAGYFVIRRRKENN